MSNWFEIDKKGLAKLLEKRGKEFALFELVQNAWDQKVTEVKVSLVPMPKQPYAVLAVEDDDPEGFKDLSHAYTLFAESDKKVDATKRGRFNLGEKLVLALCEDATIATTTGAIRFNKEGRHTMRSKREAGSAFCGTIRMTREEFDRVCERVTQLIPPVPTYFNGKQLPDRDAVTTIHASLPTEVSDEEGVLRRVTRQTAITVHKVMPGETASIYEMGIPIVEIGDKWHVNVRQKVPLNMDRDNVPPSYLRELRGLVLNNTHELLDEEDAQAGWIREAASAKNVTDDAVERVMDLRFGNKRVAFDPHDPEANKLAVAGGYTVVHGGSLSAEEWANVKRADAMKPAGQVTPSPKPFSVDGKPLQFIEEEKLTDGMKSIRAHAKVLAGELLGLRDLSVRFANDIAWPFNATFGDGGLIFNVGRLGKGWFNGGLDQDVLRLLIHEFGHHYAGDHLSSEYHDALCRLGARMTDLALRKPELFKE